MKPSTRTFSTSIFVFQVATLPGRLASLAAGLAILRVYDVMLDQNSLRCNIEAVENAKFDFEALHDANAGRACLPGRQGGLPGCQPG